MSNGAYRVDALPSGTTWQILGPTPVPGYFCSLGDAQFHCRTLNEAFNQGQFGALVLRNERDQLIRQQEAEAAFQRGVLAGEARTRSDIAQAKQDELGRLRRLTDELKAKRTRRA